MTNLNKISITGADDNTNIDELLQIFNKYKNYLELGLLYFPEKEGQTRNPSKLFRQRLLHNIPKDNTSIHLCGEDVFKQIISDKFKSSSLKQELSQFGRIQLNINAREYNYQFTYDEISLIYKKLLSENFTIIAQYNTKTKNHIENFLNNEYDFIDKTSNSFIYSKSYSKFHVLLDSSLGKGVSPEHWNVPKFQNIHYLGFAGGLNNDNIFEAYQKIDKQMISPYYLDLESGARTNNGFDLNKVDNIAQQFKQVIMNN